MRIVGILRRCFITRDKDILVRAYNCYVRPIIEYCSVVISPFWKKDISLLEKPLRKLTKYIVGFKSGMGYEDRLKNLEIPSVVTRRSIADLAQVHKIVHKKSFVKFDTLFKNSVCNRTRKNNNFKLRIRKRNTTRRESTFAFRVVNTWNSLDESIVNTNLCVFKKMLLQKFLKLGAI